VLKKKKKGCSGDDDFVNRASVLAVFQRRQDGIV